MPLFFISNLIVYNSYMKRKGLLQFISTSVIFVLGTGVVNAQPRITEISEIFQNVMELVFPIGGLVAVGMVIYGGYMWMIAGGDPSKAKQAQGVLTWAIIGLLFLAVFGLLLKLFLDFLRG